jgi:hypothetical protein
MATNNDITLTTTSLFQDRKEVLRRFRVGVQEALRDHKRVGNPVAVWQDNRVVLTSQEENEKP